jgi:simple sugar transport system ATP-binding protein
VSGTPNDIEVAADELVGDRALLPTEGAGRRAAVEWSLEARAIVKHFGAVRANDGIDVTLRPGEIHALLGENGAGKSTLVKLIAGVYTQDDGELLIAGRPVQIDSPRTSRELGIAVVHQSSSLVPALTLLENTVLLTDSLGRIDGSIRQAITRTASTLGFELDPDQKISRMSVGQRQRAEIVRALMHDARLILLDEPTAVLAPQECRELFALLKRLVASGTGVVLVTHRLDEALEQSDRMTVLRQGKVVGASDAPSELTTGDVVRMLVGEVKIYARKPRAIGPPVLDATGLVGAPPHGHPLRGVNLSVGAGEVLGVAGVEGNGQHELAAALVGSWQPDEGTVVLSGRSIFDYTARQRVQLVADVPDDDGVAVIADAPVWQNLALGELSWESAPTPRTRRRLRAAASRLVEEFEIKTASVDTPVGRLSGGNRRRVVLARELSKASKLVVASYATKGLDVRSVEAVKTWVGRLAGQGAAVVYIAAELEELLDISDRIAVLARGRITGVMPSKTANVGEIGRLMLAESGEEASAA